MNYYLELSGYTSPKYTYEVRAGDISYFWRIDRFFPDKEFVGFK